MTETETPTEWRPKVAMIAYPGLTMLDLIGPWESMRPWCDLHLLGSTTEEFYSDTGLPFRTPTLLADADDYYDVVFVPGGDGAGPAQLDTQIIDFLKDRGSRAKYVTSACTGALVLGAAGLLDGYKATTHWSTVGALDYFGAIYTEGRVVKDRNRITGGGVTAGIDFGLTLLAEMLGEEQARYAQLLIEYNPDPPFDGGDPKNASQANIDLVMEYVRPVMAEFKKNAETLLAK